MQQPALDGILATVIADKKTEMWNRVSNTKVKEEIMMDGGFQATY